MPHAKLKVGECEIVLDGDVITIGRVAENDIAFPDDSNVSRYHAEIEYRGGDHWLIDLKSSNGTTVNGTRVVDDVCLRPGDKLEFGGSSRAEFGFGEVGNEMAAEVGGGGGGEFSNMPGMGEAGSQIGSIGSEAEYGAENAARDAIFDGIHGTGASASESASAATSAANAAEVTGSNPTVLVAGAVCGLAVVAAIAAGAFYMTRSSSCQAKAAIVKPEVGDTISAPVDIEVQTQDAGCVQSAVFTVDGQEVASGTPPNFAATLDPKDVPELADGVDHSLQIVLIDDQGQKIPQSGSVMVAFETRAIVKASPTPGTLPANTKTVKSTGQNQPSLVQINDMAQRLVKEFGGGFSYNVSNKQFLQAVQQRTAEYAQDGYFERAAVYRDIINVAFVREQNIDAPFAFILAMSRSKFNPAKQGDLEGLFQMSSTFVNDNKYNGQCGTETLSDPSQNCAARSAALYMKAIVFGVFGGDDVYSAAAFGKSPQDAGSWAASLGQNRSDLWSVIKMPAEQDQLVRFFAAGIVAENPQAFGLKDHPLSELYRVTM